MRSISSRKALLFSPDEWLVFGCSVALFAIAVTMRVHQLALSKPFDLDEGVYWQSLRAMHAGAALYREIYFSQPPLFLITVFPAYMLFGQTIFAARLGVAIASLVGLCGGYVLGRAVSGGLGGFGALALLVVSAPYLVMSQTLQAEARACGDLRGNSANA